MSGARVRKMPTLSGPTGDSLSPTCCVVCDKVPPSRASQRSRTCRTGLLEAAFRPLWAGTLKLLSRLVPRRFLLPDPLPWLPGALGRAAGEPPCGWRRCRALRAPCGHIHGVTEAGRQLGDMKSGGREVLSPGTVQARGVSASRQGRLLRGGLGPRPGCGLQDTRPWPLPAWLPGPGAAEQCGRSLCSHTGRAPAPVSASQVERWSQEGVAG